MMERPPRHHPAIAMAELSIDRLPIVETDNYRRADIRLLECSIELLRAHRVAFVAMENGNGLARLVNLLFWRAGERREYVDGSALYADQVIHLALHQLVDTLVSRSHPRGSLFAECLASASDVYLLGKLMGGGEETDFLRDTLASFGTYYEMYAHGEGDLERIIRQLRDDPFAAMTGLASFLEFFCLTLLESDTGEEARQKLLPLTTHRFYPLVHHYHTANWVLSLRNRFTGAAPPPADLERLRARIQDGEEAFLSLFEQTIHADGGSS